MKKDAFYYVMTKGFIGAFIGIFAGLALAVIVWVLEMGVVLLSQTHGRDFNSIPLAVITLPAMCIGAIIGASSGISAANRDAIK